MEDFAVVFEDDSLIVVNKKAGTLVHPASESHSGTFLDFLRPRLLAPPEDFEEIERPGIVHRLDRETSGLLLAAKTPDAEIRLKAFFRKRKVEKIYRALVKGMLFQAEGFIDTPLTRSPNYRLKHMVSKKVLEEDEPTGNAVREALTEFFVEERFDKVCLLRIRLHTGRTHQIRVHLSSVNHPVIGDRFYDRNVGNEKKLFLAATDLGFKHPVSGEWMSFSIPLPDFFESRLSELRLAGAK